MSFCIASVGLP